MNRKKRFVLASSSLLLICLTAVSISSQLNNGSAPKSWVKVEGGSGEFSLMLPSADFIVDGEDGFLKIHYLGQNYSAYITMRKTKDAKRNFREQLSFPFSGADSYEHFEMGDFLIKQRVSGKEKGDGISLNIASSTAAYTLSANAEEKSNPDYLRIATSLKLGGKYFFVNTSDGEIATRSIQMETLKSDASVLIALAVPDSTQTKLERVPENEKDLKPEKRDYSRKLVFLRQPYAPYTSSARQNNSQGTVKLRIVFRASGEVGPIKLVSSSVDRSLEKNALDAARRIKFLPAEIEGKRVDVEREMEYTFTIY